MMRGNLVGMALVTCAAIVFTGLVPAPAWSTGENFMTIRDREDVSVAGEVTSISRDRLTINTGSSTIDIDLRSLAPDMRLDTIIQPGMHVVVDGALDSATFNTPVVIAREITAATAH